MSGNMNNYYQMTLLELYDDHFVPVQESHLERGLIDYFCPVCNEPVGIFSTGAVHDWGWVMKRDECKNGHVISWGGRL